MSDDTAFRQQVGERVRAARRKTGLSQQDVAAHLGITHQQVNKIERGKANPPFRRIVQIAQATSHDVGFFAPVDGATEQSRSDVNYREFQLVKRLARLPKPQYDAVAALLRTLAGEGS